VTLAALVVIASLAFIYRHVSDEVPMAGPPKQLFATVDDGKTFFVAPGDQLPPYEHEGKTALRAHVFSCDGGRTRFVGYLERYSLRAKALMIETWKAEKTNGGRPSVNQELFEGIEIKKPGDADWVRQSEVARAASITNVRCPESPDASAEMILP